MQRRKLSWVILGGMVAVIIAVLWYRSRLDERPRAPVQAANVQDRQEPDDQLGGLNYVHSTPVPSTNTAKTTNVSHNIPLLAYRLKNTEKPIGELIYNDSAILLRNALFDSAEPAPLQIPAHLKAQGDPGSYVIQARGAIDQAFIARLKAAGAEIISYIPNNAYLVRASEAVANQLSTAPETQSVLPWEPYFKLDLSLLPGAINQEPFPDNERVSIVVFPGQREAGFEAIRDLGGNIVGEDTSPFGHQIITYPKADSLVALAQLPIVQSIEPHRGRVLANDLSRVRVSVTTNTLPAAPNYLNLIGSNVVVGISDTGVEAAHPDLTGRVSGAIFDNVGHGTHVAGTIASSGLNSPPSGPGSVPGATFRGVAPGAKLFSQRFDLLAGPASDSLLQQNVARTNILISNNSWSYSLFEYNQAAASYDAAVRDALPGVAAMSPVVFVFAAGNSAEADTEGRGISGDSVASPGTAKNVITVGAIENFRMLTNQFQIGGATNAHYQSETDSDNQVAAYSSRGNVGIGLEGEFGRFKPDITAPGSWVVSTRSSQWRDPTNQVNFSPIRLVDQFIDRKSTNFYFRTIPDNATIFQLRVLRNSQSPTTIPNLLVHTNYGAPPIVGPGNLAGVIGPGQPALAISPVGPGQLHFALVNTNSIAIHFDLLTIVVTTNELGDYYVELKKLNDQLAPYYRFESGTSMAAGAVSGTLALMQEFFREKLGVTNPSPALLKAMLINGARPLPCLDCGYDLQVNKQINDQGWGLIRITNSLPGAMARGSGTELTWPMILIDEDPDEALATGEEHTYNIELSTRARFEPLMVTVVWTDPPGNPVASTKLVNDLDLIVTNLVTGSFYVGNNIPAGDDFTEASSPAFSNAPPSDVVNNVENVFVEPQPTLAARYSVTVRARRVNVNAITAHTNGTRQDYALVISSGNSSLSNTFINFNPPIAKTGGTDTNPYLRSLSNKVALLNQRVGANSPQLDVIPGNIPGPSHGSTNQWNFYVFNNTNANFTNVAFFTFLPPDLSLPRIREADIDIYVSRDGGLTNLEPAVLNDPATLRSTTRGGTELIVIPNAGVGEYFIGVKSEDQQGASFAIYAIAQEKPFGSEDENGNILLDFDIGTDCIPDGTPANPGGQQFFTIVAGFDPSRNIRRVILTNDVVHERGGDLLGTITMFPFGPGANGLLTQPASVLNNHRDFNGLQRFIYDDSGEDDIPFSRQSDGPGSLRDFEGRNVNGLWQFTMIDNTPFHTGCVTRVFGLIEPQSTNGFGDGVVLTLEPGKWRYTAVDVPLNVTNLQVFVRQEPATPLPLDVYIRRNLRPTLTDYDKNGRVFPPGGVVEHGRYDFPSLRSGRYHIGIHNPNSAPVRFRIRIEFQYSLQPLELFSYTSTNAATIIPDDLTTNFVIGVTNSRNVADVKVGVRIDHPRLSDLVLHLVSPEGTRILLTENRGLSLGTNYGVGIPEDFIFPFASAGTADEFRTNIDATERQGFVRINYDFFNAQDYVRVYYEGRKIFDSGFINGAGVFNIPFGPGISTFVEVVVNEGGNPNGGTQWNMVVSITGPWNYAFFTDQATLGDPIKFAFPPFSRIPTNITVFSNHFENAFAGLYDTNAPFNVFDGWTVRSNSVGILTDTNTAQSGSNFLALSHGMISRGVTNLQAGREYFFNFAQRKISSSPTQSVLRSFPPTIFTPYWNLTNPPVNEGAGAAGVSKLRVCPGQDVTVISTNQVTNNGVVHIGQGDTNDLVFNIPRYGLIGCWSSHPAVLNPGTRASVPFYIGGGTNVIAAPSGEGNYYLFLGINDDDYTDNTATGLLEVELRWAQCQLAQGSYVLGTTPIPFEGAWRTNWTGESLFFLANPLTTNVAFRSDINTTILLDTVVIDEIIPSAHYQSEEPLAPLKGEFALGDWKLEVTDNRVGPPIVDTNEPTLLSWSLNFVFEDGPNPIALTNGIPYTAQIRGPQVYYFVVNVPFEITTNSITLLNTGTGAAGTELIYNPFGLPQGTIPPDPLPPMPQNNTMGVSTDLPLNATITPGRSYFLAVRNVDPTEVNDFALTVVFENIPITQLPHNIPVAAVIDPLPATFLQTRANPSLAISNMHYYYFDVGSSDPNATNLFFEIIHPTPASPPSQGANVHLVASRALPVVNLYPTPTSFEYQNTETIAPDKIIVTSNSIPVRLGPGRWYLGVYNVGTAPASYQILAFESAAPVFNLTYLDVGATNVVITNFLVPPRNVLNSFYHFITHDTNAAVLFEMVGPERDVDLIVRRSDLPSRDLYDFSFLSTGPSLPGPGASRNNGFEPIPIRTNVFVPTLGVGTNWYFTVVNRDLNNSSTGMLCVKIFMNINPIVGCVFNARFGVPNAGQVQLCWDSVPGNTYDVETTADLINWTAVATNVPSTAPENCVTVPAGPTATLEFYRIRANP